MNVANQNLVGVLHNFSRVVSENYLAFCTCFVYKLRIVFYVIYTCELVLRAAEMLSECRNIQYVSVRIKTLQIYFIRIHNQISLFICRV